MVDVCKVVIELPTSPNKIIVISLCILCNLLSLKSCNAALLKSTSLYDVFDKVLTSTTDPAVLSQCLKAYIITFSLDQIYTDTMTESRIALVGATLEMIQTNSLDPELLARSI